VLLSAAAFGVTFKAAGNYVVGNHPVAIAAGDFKGDGRIDLAVANSGSKTVSVLFGNGDGTFGKAAEFEVGIVPSHIVVADVNGDGRADIAVIDARGARISVLLGRGDGGFLPHSEMDARQAPELAGSFKVSAPAYSGTQTASVVFADFNGDGRVDEAVAMSGKNKVSVLLNVVEGSSVGTDILLNSGFESGTLSPWMLGRNFCAGACEPWADLTYHAIQGTWDAGNEGNMELVQDFSATDSSSVTRVGFFLMHPAGAIVSALDFFYTDGTDDEYIVFPSSGNWEEFDVTSDVVPGKSLDAFSVWGYSGGSTPTPITFYDGIEILVN